MRKIKTSLPKKYANIFRGFPILAFSMVLFMGCNRNTSPPTTTSGVTNAVEPSETEGEKPFDYAKWQRDKEAKMALADKIMSNPPHSLRIHLPNWVSGPGRPRPVGINFYMIDDNYTN